MTGDFDLTGIDWEPIGNMNDMENHSTLFLGSFDGGDHTISNLKYESDKYNCGAGLFGVNCGEVKNLTVENAEVTVTDGTSLAIGGVVGYNMGSVYHVTLKGNSVITGNNCTGGIVGGNNNSVTNCSAENVTVIVIGDNEFEEKELDSEDENEYEKETASEDEAIDADVINDLPEPEIVQAGNVRKSSSKVIGFIKKNDNEMTNICAKQANYHPLIHISLWKLF